MPSTPSVLFVCLHGSAKSVVAAHHLRRLAESRGRPVTTGSAGVEPDEELPPRVIAGLRTDGIDVGDLRPRAVTPELVRAADLVVTFGCDVPEPGPGGPAVVRWDDVPHVSDGYESARDAIVRRLDALIERLP